MKPTNKKIIFIFISLTIISTILAISFCYVMQFTTYIIYSSPWKSAIEARSIISGYYAAILWGVRESYRKILPFHQTRFNFLLWLSVVQLSINGIIGTVWILIRIPTAIEMLIPLWIYVLGTGLGFYILSKKTLKGMRKEDVFN